MLVKCFGCQKEICVTPSRLKNKTICCSIQCLGIYRKKQYTHNVRICSVCKKEFKRKPCSFKRAKNGITCSRKCSYVLKESTYMGRNNPNCKYTELPDNYFKEINTEQKAYILGWIASDGSIKTNNTIVINIHQKDQEILEKIKNCISQKLILKFQNRKNASPMVSLCLNSKEMCLDVCSHLKINPGKKAYKMRLPDLEEGLMWHFIRGYFDGDGSIRQVTDRSLDCSIASVCKPIKEKIQDFCKISCSVNPDSVYWSTDNAMKFLNRLYQNSSIQLDRKYKIYQEWKNMYEQGFKTVKQMKKSLDKKGDRIAQLVIVPVPQVELIETENLSETTRGTGAFGSTGR